jgi:hypothetical protein
VSLPTKEQIEAEIEDLGEGHGWDADPMLTITMKRALTAESALASAQARIGELERGFDAATKQAAAMEQERDSWAEQAERSGNLWAAALGEGRDYMHRELEARQERDMLQVSLEVVETERDAALESARVAAQERDRLRKALEDIAAIRASGGIIHDAETLAAAALGGGA